MVIVEFLGYRLVAESILPINGDATLVYGSRDGGKTVVASDKVRNTIHNYELNFLLNVKYNVFAAHQ